MVLSKKLARSVLLDPLKNDGSLGLGGSLALYGSLISFGSLSFDGFNPFTASASFVTRLLRWVNAKRRRYCWSQGRSGLMVLSLHMARSMVVSLSGGMARFARLAPSAGLARSVTVVRLI
jgi:hypothetical protein